MSQPFVLIGAILGGLGVALGAFGAHALKATLEQSGRVSTWETAAKYQLVHAVALLVVGMLAMRAPDASAWLGRAGWSMTAGTLIFSGSLYVLCATGARWLGAITPIGGTLLIAGWAMLAFAASKL